MYTDHRETNRSLKIIIIVLALALFYVLGSGDAQVYPPDRPHLITQEAATWQP